MARRKKDRDGDDLNPRGDVCVTCGKVAVGYAYVNDDRHCHGRGRDCYQRAQAKIAGPPRSWPWGSLFDI